MKKQYSKQYKSIKQVEANNEKLFNSKLNDTEKERIRKCIDKNIGKLKERFCPHEFFKLVNEYQKEAFSNKEIKRIRRKYKRYKLNLFEDKYINLYEEYFYKSKYFMYYFKTKIKKNYFDKTAQQLYEDYKFGYDLNLKNRSDTFKYLSAFGGGLLAMVIPTWIRSNKHLSVDWILIFVILIIIATTYFLVTRFEDNAYDSRLFIKLLQDEFDNNK